MWGISFIEDRDLISANLILADLRPTHLKFYKTQVQKRRQ
jgi:hypothetical protein